MPLLLTAGAAASPLAQLSFNVKSYGAKGDGSTDDTTAVQAAMNAAYALGAEVFFPAGDFIVAGNLTLPSPSGTPCISFRGVGTSHGTKGSAAAGSRLIHTKVDGSDLLSVSAAGFANPTYAFRGLTLIGPDAFSPRGTASGWGIKIAGNASPRVFMHDVKVRNFYGAAGGGISLANCTLGSLENVVAQNCATGLKLDVGCNAFTFVGCEFGLCSVAGTEIVECQTQTWSGCAWQSNEKTALLVRGLVAAHFSSPHFENNNTSNTADEWAIKLRGESGRSIQHVLFSEPGLWTARDRVSANGVSGYIASGVRFVGGYSNPVTPPVVTLGTFSQDCTIDGLCAPADVSDAGSRNRVIWQGVGSDLGVRYGTGSPEGAVTAGIGTLYRRTDGGAGTTLYIKESGSGNTGWVAK